MRFTLIDRIDHLEPGVAIRAVKSLSLAEEYLADHFPRFPVMPGVLMLEAMTQAGAWLVRATEDFAHSMVVLKEARNVKYNNFVAPGQTLTVTAEIIGHDERETSIKARGMVEGQPQFTGRIVLERYNLADRNLGTPASDVLVTRQMRALYALLRPQVAQPSGVENRVAENRVAGQNIAEKDAAGQNVAKPAGQSHVAK